ncbi:MAG: outer membrane beta-barrel protein [Cytophagaceae bacterium]
MKKLFLITLLALLFSSLQSSAQRIHPFVVRAGAGTYTFLNKDYNTHPMLGYSFSFLKQFNIGQHFFIQSGLQYERAGGDIDVHYTSNGVSPYPFSTLSYEGGNSREEESQYGLLRWRNNNLILPVQFMWGFGEDVRFSFGPGFFISYILSGEASLKEGVIHPIMQYPPFIKFSDRLGGGLSFEESLDIKTGAFTLHLFARQSLLANQSHSFSLNARNLGLLIGAGVKF